MKNLKKTILEIIAASDSTDAERIEARAILALINALPATSRTLDTDHTFEDSPESH